MDRDNGLASTVPVVPFAIFDPDGPPGGGDDSYSTPAGQTLSVAAPGVLANDANPQAGTMTAGLAAGPAHGALGLNAHGGFPSNPQAGSQGADSFTSPAHTWPQTTPAPGRDTLGVRAGDTGCFARGVCL